MFNPLSIVSDLQKLPIAVVQCTRIPIFAPSALNKHANREMEKPQQQRIQHRDVSMMADYHVVPGPKQFKRCNDIIRSLAPTDNLGCIPQVFQALDEAFFNGRVGKVASAVGVRSRTPYTAGVGGYSFRDGDAGRLVIRLPTWDGKSASLLEDLNILFREMAFLDFYLINSCRCDDCLSSSSSSCSNNGVKVYEFVEYLTRLDKLANLNLEGFEKQWSVREVDDFDVAKEYLLEKASQAGKVEQTSPDCASYIRQLEEATERAKFLEKLYRGALENTTIEQPNRRKSMF